jgi:ribosomal protein S18 acetylase RimI-like enzyme
MLLFMAEIQYKKANEKDIPAMARLRSARWGTEEYWNARITGYMRGESDPQQALKPRMLFVAVDGENVVGFIAGHLTRRYGCDGELEWIDVSLEYRGKGIAWGLFRRLAIWFIEQKSLKICVDVDPDNLVAVKFYTRHGAEPLNKHWMFWKDISLVAKSETGS